jgi:hypothetical protein
VQEERTFPVDPQQGTCHLPFFEDVAVTEPLCRSHALETARNIVSCGWIGRRLPFPKSLPVWRLQARLSPCDRIRYLTLSEEGTDDERIIVALTAFTSYATCRITNFASLPSKLVN